jgi:hypothetical protein
MNVSDINLLTIKQTLDKTSPYVVKDIKGKIVFYAKYEHEAEAFVRGVQFANRKQAERDLWANFKDRFEVMEKDGFFYVYDHAEKMILENGLFQNEIEAEDLKEDTIKFCQDLDRYETNSGR